MGAKNSVDFVEVNGVKIPIVYELSNALPLGSIGVKFYGGGKVYEPKVALAAFSASLLNRGSKKSGEMAFAELLESNAVEIGASSGMEALNLEVNFLLEKKDVALTAFAELLSAPNFTDEAFEKTALLMKSSLLAKENDFDYIAQNNLYKLIFKGTPLENSGTVADIENLTLKDAQDFVESTMTLENAVILIAGDLDLEATKREVAEILAILPKGKKITKRRFLPSTDSQSVSVAKPTKQAFIYFASPFNFVGYEQDLHKIALMSFIMGSSGFGSRVMEEIRVKRGLAYSAYFYITASNVSAHTMGYLQTSLENKDEAISVLKRVVGEFLKKGVTQRELDDAKAYILGSKVLSEETLSQRLGKKFSNFNRGLPLDYDKILIQKIKNLTLTELNAYIKSHSEVGDLSFSIVVDK